jgi:chromosome segregation ATPase
MTLVSETEPPGDSETTAPAPGKSRRPWIWSTAVLAIVAAGLLVWALTIRSDLDSTQQELDSAQQELADTQKKLDSTSKELAGAQQDIEELGSQAAEDDSHPGVVLAAGKVLYDEFSAKLDAAREDLAANEQALADAEKATAQAEKDAAAAQQNAAAASDETAKANAEAEQARAEAKAAESRAAAAAACAKSYISAFGLLFEGENPKDQADAVRKELSRITEDCSDDLSAAAARPDSA